MTIFDHHDFAERFAAAINDGDHQAMGALVTEDFVADWPQSGERVHGAANFNAILSHFPGQTGGPFAEPHTLQSQATDEMRLVAPSFTFVAVEGAGNTGTMTMEVKYPDRSIWWAIILYRLKDNRMFSSTSFFAPVYPAPQWRAQWVERIG